MKVILRKLDKSEHPTIISAIVLGSNPIIQRKVSLGYYAWQFDRKCIVSFAVLNIFNNDLKLILLAHIPTDGQLNSFAKHVMTNQKFCQIGRYLGLTEPMIQEVLEEHSLKGLHEQSYQTFCKWKMIQGKDATCRKLFVALTKMDESASLVQTLLDILKSSWYIYWYSVIDMYVFMNVFI